MGNFIKVNLSRLGETSTNGEGVWAEFASKSDEAIYEDEKLKGEKFSVILRNHPVTTDKLQWGDTVSVFNNGSQRPSLVERV